MNADEKAVADVQVPLWDAINRYATTCGGDPSQHVYGNTPRMTAVADTNRVIHNLAARIRADAERETERLRKAMSSASASVRSAFRINANPESKPWNRQHLCDFLDGIADTLDAALKGDA